MKIAAGFLVLCGFVNVTSAFSLGSKPLHDGDVIEVQLRDLRPTQSSVGFDEIYYRLERFSEDREKMFNAFCALNGAGGVTELTDASRLQDEKSFVCEEPVGSHPEDMGTVVIGPNGECYLTDGHHKAQEFWRVSGGGPNLNLHVLVARDDRALASMDAFWEKMRVEKNVWLFDDADRPISVAQLPVSLGLEHFHDDPYRSMMYFTDHIAWEKPQPDVPFVEFYWAREVRKTVALSNYKLTSVDGYLAAMRAVSDAILNSDSRDVGGSGKTAEEMGQRRFSKHHKLDRALEKWKDGLAELLRYKSTVEAAH